MNGVFGIKPTWGRISREGDAATGSVSHVGPIASSTKDLAYFLEATCGEDLLDREGRLAMTLPAQRRSWRIQVVLDAPTLEEIAALQVRYPNPAP